MRKIPDLLFDFLDPAVPESTLDIKISQAVLPAPPFFFFLHEPVKEDSCHVCLKGFSLIQGSYTLH